MQNLIYPDISVLRFTFHIFYEAAARLNLRDGTADHFVDRKSIFDFCLEDISLENYEPYPPIKGKVAV